MAWTPPENKIEEQFRYSYCLWKSLSFPINKKRISREKSPEVLIKNLSVRRYAIRHHLRSNLRSWQSQASPHGGQTPSEYGAEYAEPIRQWATGMGIPVTVRGEQKLENASLRTLKDFPRHGENSKYDINFNSWRYFSCKNAVKGLWCLQKPSTWPGGK